MTSSIKHEQQLKSLEARYYQRFLIFTKKSYFAIVCVYYPLCKYEYVDNVDRYVQKELWLAKNRNLEDFPCLKAVKQQWDKV